MQQKCSNLYRVQYSYNISELTDRFVLEHAAFMYIIKKLTMVFGSNNKMSTVSST